MSRHNCDNCMYQCPPMTMIRSIAISMWLSGNWSFDLAAELSSCQIGEIWKKNGRQRNFHKGLKDKIQLNNFATLYKVSAWDTYIQGTCGQWKSFQGTPSKGTSSQTEHSANRTSSDTSSQRNIQSNGIQLSGHPPFSRGEQEGLFGSREREWELKSTFTS